MDSASNCIILVLFVQFMLGEVLCDRSSKNGAYDNPPDVHTFSGRTFKLKRNLSYIPFNDNNYMEFESFLYRSNPIRSSQGQILVLTQPDENGGRVINPGLSNAFVGSIFRAYSEHRHLILRPDDVWLAITTAFSLYMNSGDNAEKLRQHFVNFEGKRELEVKAFGSIYTADWSRIVQVMSKLIEKNTVSDVRQWLEPDFSTTTKKMKTVGRVVLMGAMQNYFEYKIGLMCGLPKVTLEGSLEDWQRLREKANHIKTFNTTELTHWAGLLDVVLEKFIQSYKGEVDRRFWSRVVKRKSWGSGSDTLTGWINVFMPFTERGQYQLRRVKPHKNKWRKIYCDDIHPSIVEVPVKIDDNGVKYDTMFYSGHMVALYDPEENTIRPSLDWAIVDITGKNNTATMYKYDRFKMNKNERNDTRPYIFTYNP